jgi:ABC-type phosphate transport system permease subunit
MKPKTKRTIITWGMSILVFITVIVIIVLMLSLLGDRFQEAFEINQEKCCTAGYTCTDVYWDEQSQSCKSTPEFGYYPSLKTLLIAGGISLLLGGILTLLARFIQEPNKEEEDVC